MDDCAEMEENRPVEVSGGVSPLALIGVADVVTEPENEGSLSALESVAI